MNVAIIGSRTFTDYKLMVEVLDKEDIDVIVSGGARGADFLAGKYAIEMDIECIIFIPQWELFGKAAGFIRNKHIVDECDMLIAFWDGSSKGTLNSINTAKKQGKEVKIIRF